ncbi:DUF341 domain protein [Lentithecium fluviatile CBS 122367]|uniref:DUF341 domain protein n=1 Tax=Lentithecium fluviatile CBS 122367 TaxID=1168545 RepID=A0A6G1J8N8_9PLEO|nr:DUF341 domain protein [Lentithecium fluviatile CBS 122367]
MHFLCLHGLGTNNHVFQTQTATIRYDMDKHHTFEFVEGTEVMPIAIEIAGHYPSGDTYFGYYTSDSESILQALDRLEVYIAEEGPFDGAIGFSQGATLLSTYLIKLGREQPGRIPPFRCAIFFSAAQPHDIIALADGVLKGVEPDAEGPLIRLPTAHMWGHKDTTYRTESEILCSMCEPSLRDTYVHGQGHEIPGPRAKEDVQFCLRTIRRTIDKAAVEH